MADWFFLRIQNRILLAEIQRDLIEIGKERTPPPPVSEAKEERG